MSDVNRLKVEAGDYLLVTPGAEFRAVKLAEREWVVRVDEEEEIVDVGEFGTLSEAEEAVSDPTTARHFLDRAEAVLNGREIDWSVDPSDEPVEVAWMKPSGHGPSSRHLTNDGEQTLCGIKVRTDRPRLESGEDRGLCGHCFD